MFKINPTGGQFNIKAVIKYISVTPKIFSWKKIVNIFHYLFLENNRIL